MSAWFRLRFIATTFRQSPAALLYLAPLLTYVGWIVYVAAYHPHVLSVAGAIFTGYGVLVAAWMSIRPLSRSRFFDPGLAGWLLAAALAVGALLGLILTRVAPTLDRNIFAIAAVVLALCFLNVFGWSGFFACPSPGCHRPFALIEIIRENEPYQSHSLDLDGTAVTVPAKRTRTLRVCKYCGNGARSDRWTRDPAKYFQMVTEESAKLTDRKARTAVWLFYLTLGLLVWLMLWAIAKLRRRASGLMPAS